MPGSPQGSARPCDFSSRRREDTPIHSVDHGVTSAFGTCAPSGVEYSPEWSTAGAAVLDRAIFAGQGRFVGIDAANVGLATAADVATAQQLLAERVEVVTLAGPLHERVLAADVDAADTGAEAEAGQAVAEDLIAWCEARGLPWLLRASGRPGGRHVLVLALEASLAAEWRLLCGRLATHHGVSVSPRRTLRLLSTPHRLGFDAPILGGVLRSEDIPASTSTTTTPASYSGRCGGRRRKRSATAGSRSESEFGAAVARARAGWTVEDAWGVANQPGSKAAEMGEVGWRRWMWCKATTIAAAEQRLNEDEAWRRFEHASARRAHQLGREAWRQQFWQPALDEAATDRPRRTRTDHTAVRSEEEQTEIEAVRTGLRHAANAQLTADGRYPQFARSVAAVIDALAEHVVCRDGSISERSWSEAASVDRKTLRAAREFLREHGILHCARSYQGGTKDSAAWLPGDTATPHIRQARKTSSTRWYTPLARMKGSASSELLRRRHCRERQVFLLKQKLSVRTDTTGEFYKDSQDPAAKMLRSLWHQRRWWVSLTPDQQRQRCTQRRDLLGRLHRTERAAWLDWIDRRAALRSRADRVDADGPLAGDYEALATAPRIVHLGMRDPGWRVGGSSVPAERPRYEGNEEPEYTSSVTRPLVSQHARDVERGRFDQLGTDVFEMEVGMMSRAQAG